MTLNDMLSIGTDFYLAVYAYLDPNKIGKQVELFNDVDKVESEERYKHLRKEFGDSKVEWFTCGDNTLIIDLDEVVEEI